MTKCSACGQYHAAQDWREDEFKDLAAELAEANDNASKIAVEAIHAAALLKSKEDELAEAKKERDALKALLAEWLDGMYQGPDFLRRVKIAVHGTLAEIVRGAKE